MSQPGRPRALDDFKRREVCALVAVGCGIDGAAHYVGCNPTTIRREALRNPEFHDQLRNAELQNQLDPLRAMRKAAATHWRAAAWLLERTLPDRFARRQPESMSPDEVDEMLTELFEQLFIAVPNPEPLRRVMLRIGEFVRSTLHEKRAATHTRRNPHRRQRRTTPYPPPILMNQQHDLETPDGEGEAPARLSSPKSAEPRTIETDD